MEMKPVQIFLPAHAHQALRIFCITNGTTMARCIVEAIDAKYPTLRALEPHASHSAITDTRRRL